MTHFFAPVVYLLCFGASSSCAILLGRNFRRTRARLLLWSATCFWLLAANNLILVLDLIVLPAIDLQVPRLLLSLAAIGALVSGFIWNAEEE